MYCNFGEVRQKSIRREEKKKGYFYNAIEDQLFSGKNINI